MRLSTVILPSERWNVARENWRRADEYGLFAAYTYDHLSWRNFRERTWFTMIPTLVAAAGVTTSIRLGPLVTSPNFRHPLLLAKDLIALDDVSSGRVIVGVGSGGTGFDASVLAQAPWSAAERHERFEAFTLTLDQLLREDATSTSNTYYPIVESRQIPGPVQLERPPIYVSAFGPKSMALAVRVGDGWISIGDPSSIEPGSTFRVVRDQVTRLDELLAHSTYAARPFEKVLLDYEGDERPLDSFEAFLDWAGRYWDLGVSELVVHWPVADSQFACDPATFERIVTEGREMIETWPRDRSPA